MSQMKSTIEGATCIISSADAPKNSTLNLAHGDSISVVQGLELKKAIVIPLPKFRELKITEDCYVLSIEFLKSGVIIITDLEGQPHKFDSSIDFTYPGSSKEFELENDDLLWSHDKGGFIPLPEDTPTTFLAFHIREPDTFPAVMLTDFLGKDSDYSDAE